MDKRAWFQALGLPGEVTPTPLNPPPHSTTADRDRITAPCALRPAVKLGAPRTQVTRRTLASKRHCLLAGALRRHGDAGQLLAAQQGEADQAQSQARERRGRAGRRAASGLACTGVRVSA